jgi:hypothetical protein
MIKYTASGIIKRAEQIADLENSDFITESEKLTLLNESFQILFQKVINTNDRFFIQEVTVENGMELPSDFYQLSNLYVKKTHQPITKRNNVQVIGYEIKNNNIYLSEEYHNAEIIMEYIPCPPTIELKEKTKDSPFTVEPLAANHKIYVTVSEGKLLEVRYIGSDNVIETNIGYEPTKEYSVFDNGILYSLEGVNTFYDFKAKKSTQLNDIPVILEDTLFVYNSGYLTDINGNATGYVINIALNPDTMIIYTDLELTYQLCSNKYIINDLDPIACSELKMKAFMNGEVIAMNKADKIIKLGVEEEIVLYTKEEAVCLVSDKYALTRNIFAGADYLEGLMDDTLLDFQNNLFYTVLAYQLAISFKVKQSADTTQLAALYDQAESQFFDSINRDNNANYQINNVYSPTLTIARL